MVDCPVCLHPIGSTGMAALADHLVERAAGSDVGHIRFLNQNLTRKRSPASELVPGLERLYEIGPAGGLSGWITRRFVTKFFGPRPHPFVVALQHPSRATLLGYVVEHQHFLRQWVRSCAFVMARTDQPRVVLYELDNLTTEFAGSGVDQPSHYELLLRMGESLGVDRKVVLATPPLPATQRAIDEWNAFARERPWVAVFAAMHSLELIANRNLVDAGATVRYFDPVILENDEVTAESRAFLREGYEADVEHSEEALALVDAFATRPEDIASVQSTFLRSIDLFDDYLLARLERAAQYEA